jgi:hypothetical protein
MQKSRLRIQLLRDDMRATAMVLDGVEARSAVHESVIELYVSVGHRLEGEVLEDESLLAFADAPREAPIIEQASVCPTSQRDWKWDTDRIAALLASVSLGYPVGVVMLLESGGPDDTRKRSFECWYYLDMALAWLTRSTAEEAIVKVPADSGCRSRLGVPTLAGFLLARSPAVETIGRRLITIVAVAFFVGHFFAYPQSFRRNTVGYDGLIAFFVHPQWDPAVPAVLLSVGYVAVLAVLTAWLFWMAPVRVGSAPDAAATREGHESVGPSGSPA